MNLRYYSRKNANQGKIKIHLQYILASLEVRSNNNKKSNHAHGAHAHQISKIEAMVPPSLLFPRYTLAFILACARHWYLVLGLLVSACSQKGLHSCGVALERGKYER